ncbi:hypothetical protein EDD29_7439 [Actinocorallia herbida]|uniref:Uncharacterized protein n=1 Tax=Actinocorallia herbida TaxID=58109 RepID=A0A3N1D877_9ACTN|nr:hypothetical protein [Actinocorallia herbida]ROO89732.1 hypothetical protein EDD29_7439 [Actinocorallia herbida]
MPDGASAEAYVLSDTDASLGKARRFTEILARLLLRVTRTSVRGKETQHARFGALAAAGVPVPER